MSKCLGAARFSKATNNTGEICMTESVSIVHYASTSVSVSVDGLVQTVIALHPEGL